MQQAIEKSEDGLTPAEWQMVLTSLQYTERAFSAYTQYPSYQFKRGRMQEIQTVIKKVRIMRDEALG